MTTLAHKTQEKINALYRETILEVLRTSNKPLDHSEFANAVLGGSTPAEVQCQTHEPYVPAMCQLVKTGEIVYYRDEEQVLWTDLFSRATPAQIESSTTLMTESDLGELDFADFDNPETYRTDPEVLIEQVNANSGMPPELMEMLKEAGVFDGDDDDSGINVIEIGGDGKPEVH